MTVKSANDGMHSSLYWPARVAELEGMLRQGITLTDVADDYAEHHSDCDTRYRDEGKCDCGAATAVTEAMQWRERARALLGDKGTP